MPNPLQDGTLGILLTTDDIDKYYGSGPLNPFLPSTVVSGGGGTWGSITGAIVDQLDLAAALATKQAASANLTSWSGLAPTTAGGNIATVANPGAITFLRVNADNSVNLLSAANFRTAIGAGTGTGDALVASPLSQFAATTSAQLFGVLSDETGSGAGALAVFNINPTIAGYTLTGQPNIAPTTIVIAAHTGTINAAKPYSQATDSAACALTFSANGTAGDIVVLKLINSAAGTIVFTINQFGGVALETVTVAATSSLERAYRSTGAVWAANVGSSCILDLAADATPASTKLVETVSATTGVSTKSTIAQFLSVLPDGTTATTQTKNSGDTKVANNTYADRAGRADQLGTFAAPNTAAGVLSWQAPFLEVFTSATAALRTYTLPQAVNYAGQGVVVFVVAGVNHVNIQPYSGAQLVLAGVLLTANHYIQATTSAAGNYIALFSDGTNWISAGSSGTWTDSASA